MTDSYFHALAVLSDWLKGNFIPITGVMITLLVVAEILRKRDERKRNKN